MGLHYHLNYLVIVFVAHVSLHCFAFDLIGQKIMKPQLSQVVPEIEQYSFNNANEKADLHNKTQPSRYSLRWKWKRAGTDLNNYNNGYHFMRNLRANTKIQTTTTPLLKGSYISVISRYVSKSTTPSYIEFDYLDEDHDQDQYASSKSLDRFFTDKGVMKLDAYKTNRTVIFRPSFISYHLFNNNNDPYIRQELVATPKPIISKNRLKSLLYPYYQPAYNLKRDKVSKLKSVSDLISNMPVLGQKVVTVKLHSEVTRVSTTKSETTSKLLIPCTTSITVATSPNDRVKFFEIYDNHTLKPLRIGIQFNKSSEIQSNYTASTSKNISQIANHTHDKLRRCDNTNKTKIEKKHNYKKRSFNEAGNSTISNEIQEEKALKSFHSSIANKTFQVENKFSESVVKTKTAVVRWSSYPFASVYVYKPTQTHCDAAGISPHWLLAAGSCLSRHALVHSLHARSAFVTYCGEHWRRPERIAYVKRSVVHPKFNPRDKVRRLLYNIGLIQVSDSMAASCLRWSPVALMSHQFSTQPGGSVGSAVGWGLDRLRRRKHVTEKLPHWPLTVYDALVYCDTCPGSSEFSMAKRQEGDGASNVYCLLLPPYTKEDSDPVHGGLLLVGGKLVALYLQEERRSWGPQSAQYTGVWRLLPWVMDMAREPDDAEATFDV